MVPFEERERMEVAHTPDTDLTRRHQVLKEGEKCENSFLRLDRCFLALLRVDTHLLQNFLNALRLPSVRLAFQEEKDSVYHKWEEGSDNYGRQDGRNLCMIESRFLWKNSQAKLISGAVDVGDQSGREMAACSPCQSV